MWTMRGILALLLSTWVSIKVDAQIVLSEKIMGLSKDCAVLSAEAYKPSPNSTGFDTLINFLDEPDQALLATKDGYCYLAFRGTTLTTQDWYQNIKLGDGSACNQSGKECCTVRIGFQEAYSEPTFKSDLEKAVNGCVAKCKNKDECLVITGHSQGGAVASVAAIVFETYNPRVITFGEPNSVDPRCKIISSQRWFRYVNTVESLTGRFGIAYDPIPFAPGFGTVVFGQFIILGADTHDVAYIGLDSTKSFSPLNMKGGTAHFMKGTERRPGYLDRINTLIDNAKSYPISTKGFLSPNYCSDGSECESNICARETTFSYEECVSQNCTSDDQCDTGRCDSGNCLPKLGSCMQCDEDSDCASGKCLLFKCANIDGKMDDDCRCKWNSDCDSGRCEGFVPPICEAALPEGSSCGEFSDCMSKKCNWRFQCADKDFFGVGLVSKMSVFTAWSIVVVVTMATSFIAFVYVRGRRRDGYSAI